MPEIQYAVSRRGVELNAPGGLFPIKADLPGGSHGDRSGSRALVIIGATAVAAAAAVAYAIYRARPENKVSRLISASQRSYRSRDYAASLSAAQEALAVAQAHLPNTPEELGARLHLAGVYSATRKFEEALRELDALVALTEKIHGNESMLLVPALHAKAEVLEEVGRPLVHVADQLARVRDIRRKASGENSMDSAWSSFNLANLLLRAAQDEGLPAKTRKELLSRAESLALEACTAASALGDRDQTTEFAAKMLEVLEDAEDVEAVRLTQKLRDIYLEASGEEWVEEEEEEEEEEGAGSAAKK